MTHKIRGVRVEEYAYYVNKLRQNVGLDTWIWRQIVTPQIAHTKYKWPPYATEWTPPWKFSAYATAVRQFRSTSNIYVELHRNFKNNLLNVWASADTKLLQLWYIHGNVNPL